MDLMEQCLEAEESADPRLEGAFRSKGLRQTLTSIDYYFIVLSLVIPTGLGMYITWNRKTRLGLDEYMMAKRKMGFSLVGLSLLGTFLSGITMLKVPIDVYNQSTAIFWRSLSFFVVCAASAHIFIPVFYNLKVNSVYEYLELRFSPGIRLVGSGIFIVQMFLYIASVSYIPSILVNKVSGLDVWVVILSIGFVCTLYVAFGGIKAVLWTDCFQVVMMFAGSMTLINQASHKMSAERVWESAKRTNRILFFDDRLDPTLKGNAFSLFLMGTFIFTSLYSVNQAAVHRCLTCRTLRDAKIAIWMSLPGRVLFMLLSCAVGLCMGAFYETCDPIQAGVIESDKELIPLFIVDILSETAGQSGLYLAGVLSATLSTMSSALNSVSVAILEDFMRIHQAHVSAKQKLLYSQLLSVFIGVLCITSTFLSSVSEEATVSWMGFLGGPLIGVFSLGMFFPWANEKGAWAGLITSLVINFMIAMLPINPNEIAALRCMTTCNKTFPFNMLGVSNVTSPTAKSITLVDNDIWYGWSENWYPVAAFTICIAVGVLVSYLTGFQDPKDVDPRLIVSLMDEVFPFYWLPESIKEYFRFGIVHEDKFQKAPSDSTGPSFSNMFILDPYKTRREMAVPVAALSVFHTANTILDYEPGRFLDHHGFSAQLLRDLSSSQAESSGSSLPMSFLAR